MGQNRLDNMASDSAASRQGSLQSEETGFSEIKQWDGIMKWNEI